MSEADIYRELRSLQEDIAWWNWQIRAFISDGRLFHIRVAQVARNDCWARVDELRKQLVLRRRSP